MSSPVSPTSPTIPKVPDFDPFTLERAELLARFDAAPVRASADPAPSARRVAVLIVGDVLASEPCQSLFHDDDGDGVRQYVGWLLTGAPAAVIVQVRLITIYADGTAALRAARGATWTGGAGWPL